MAALGRPGPGRAMMEGNGGGRGLGNPICDGLGRGGLVETRIWEQRPNWQ